MPKLSIIVPVYNTEKYIEKCLNSLVNQTLEDVEIILVNDGSTDGAKEIINNFCKIFPNKILCFDKENGGLSDARNFGIQKASGEYIGFVDSDDYIEENMYEEMYNMAKQENSDIVECDFSWDFPNKTKKDIGNAYNTTEDFFTFGRVMACNKIYRKEIITANNIDFPYGLLYEDVEFFYKLIPYIKKTSHINKVFYHYVQRNNSIINSNDKKTNDIFIILKNIVTYYKEKNIYDEYKPFIEYLHIRILLGSSFLRILKINNKKTRKQLLDQTYNELNLQFPNWKKNFYLNKNKNMKNLYYKSVNKITYKFYSVIFRFF